MHQFRITNVQGDIGQNRGKFKVLWSMSHKSVYSFMNLNTVNINFKKFSNQSDFSFSFCYPFYIWTCREKQKQGRDQTRP